jgi:hypothetical protein
MRGLAAVLLVCAMLGACSRAAPPVGRWEGVYESADTMIAARMEVEADGTVRVSAPDLSNISAANEDDRVAMRQKLSDGLAAAWSDVAPRKMDFDGKVFRKPGGIAPQMVWNADAKQMTVVVYLGVRPSISIPLRAVSDFSANPWPQ